MFGIGKNTLNIVTIPNTLIFGTTGFIGSHIYKTYTKLSNKTLGFARKEKGKFHFDLESGFYDLSFVKNKDYKYAIIAAGISKIAKCETDKQLTFKCNVENTLKLIEVLKNLKIIPIVFSSDYVFDGQNGNYTENSPLNPINEYGRQKALIEQELPKICKDDYLIIRPGKVLGIELKDNSLFDEILNNFKLKNQYRAAFDQIFCPVYILDLIKAIISLQNQNLKGIYNVCMDNTISRFELACKIKERFELKNCTLLKISLNELSDSFLRPKNTSLNNRKIKETIGITFLNVFQCLDSFYQNIGKDY